MLWSTWQGTIWRGAMLVLLLWAGLAWTQTSAPQASKERIMVVHENGKATRCRIVESWQLPDRRIAHLLQSVEGGEMITIVDEQAPTGDPGDVKNARSMAKRIFSWGPGRLTPPDGSPIPPQLRIDSGLVIRNDTPPPKITVPTPAPAIVNRVVDDKVLGGGAPSNVRVAPKEQIKIDGQVVEFNPPIINVGGRTPSVAAAPTSAPQAIPQVQTLNPIVNAPQTIPQVQTLNPIVNAPQTIPQVQTLNPIVNAPQTIPQVQTLNPIVNAPQTIPQVQTLNPIVNAPQAIPQVQTLNPIVNAPQAIPQVQTLNPIVNAPPAIPQVQIPNPTVNAPPAIPQVQTLNPIVNAPTSAPPVLPQVQTLNPIVNAPTSAPSVLPQVQTLNPIVNAPTSAPSVLPQVQTLNPSVNAPSSAPSVLPQVQTLNPSVNAPSSAPSVLPQVQTLNPSVKSNHSEPSMNPRLVAQPIGDPCPPVYEISGTIVETKRSWRPGDKLQAWLLNRSAARQADVVIIDDSAILKTVEATVKAPISTATATTPKAPFSTAMPTATLPSAVSEVKKSDTPPLAISKPAEGKPGVLPSLEPAAKPAPTAEKRDMWGNGSLASLPGTAKAEPKVDPLLAPDRITIVEDPARAKAVIMPAPRPNEQWPLNSQSVLAAKSGMQGPVTYVPYPIVTVPQPHQPPMPPDPKLPDAPQLTAFVNAFTPPPTPNGQGNPGQPSMMPQGNPMLAQQQMMYQQMMRQQMMRQAMAQGPNSMMAPYRQPMPSSGPMANNSRQYQGPMPPNLIPVSAPMQTGFMPPPTQSGFMPPPMMAPPQQPIQQASYQQPMPAQQSPVAQQIDQLIKTMREAPTPSQREWAAQQLVNFEWRANPQILHALLQSASQDPAVSVRAGCVYCLGRTQASVEPVLGALNAMRNDAEPRVRQSVEQALVRLGQTQPAAR